MKTMNKKGQGAMEYLMTYGWAILVVLIVGIVLWQLGIFSGLGGSANKSLGFSGGKVGIIDASIKCTTAQALTFTVSNQAGASLSNLNVTATGCTLAANVTQDYTMIAGGTQEIAFGTCTSISTTAGDKNDIIDVTIEYNERVAGTVISRTQTGRIGCNSEV